MVDFYEVCDIVSIILQRLRAVNYTATIDFIPVSEEDTLLYQKPPVECHVHRRGSSTSTLRSPSGRIPVAIITDSTTEQQADSHADDPTPNPEGNTTPPASSSPTDTPTPRCDGAEEQERSVDTVDVY